MEAEPLTTGNKGPASPASLTIANAETQEMAMNLDLVLQYDDSIERVSIPSEEKWKDWMNGWLVHLQPSYSPIRSYELSLSFTTDAKIQALNRQYRNLDKPTNVLAFALLDDGLPPAEVLATLALELGDIVISVDTAKQQASDHPHSLECELAWLASHGLLHLLGWDHPDDHQLRKMLDQQTSLLQAVGFEIAEQFYYAADTY